MNEPNPHPITTTTPEQTNHGTGVVTYTSPDLECELTCTLGADRSCSKALDGIVKMVSGA